MGHIQIFVFCPTNFLIRNQPQKLPISKEISRGRTRKYKYTHPISALVTGPDANHITYEIDPRKI